MSTRDRFEKKYVVAPSGHWMWTACRYPNGYGQFDKGYAHRVSHELYLGPIPDGMVVDHLCRVRACVNPMHLQAVTQKENVDRGSGRQAVVASNIRRGLERTHCVNGHAFTPENTKMESKGNGKFARRCIQCQKDRYHAKRSASDRSLKCIHIGRGCLVCTILRILFSLLLRK